ncbi:Ribosome maturation factor RimM [Methyloligella halotolerans]|uniref:Ribosome maturation factor RimM n=1 Tax=Methyloligella halotolerans TaxID=1177755 RepID=A0A1E2RVT4_9HYPH|nr:ribosome maturation factor RimM [Methyloligella halotolerans]ODA66198.1 Ribosome maturation factor RimM [Methyloligella halotolerans]
MAAGEKADARLLLGEIGAAHGLKGELRLRSFTESPAAIADYGALETLDGGRSFKIAQLREGPKGLVVKFKGVNDRNAAEALTGTKLYVDRDKLPESEPDEWYYADLIGLVAVDGEGAALGLVTAVHNFGASDIIELAPESGPTLLVPFTEEAVPEVDMEAGRLTVHIPEGLVDEPSEEAAEKASEEASEEAAQEGSQEGSQEEE